MCEFLDKFEKECSHKYEDLEDHVNEYMFGHYLRINSTLFECQIANCEDYTGDCTCNFDNKAHAMYHLMKRGNRIKYSKFDTKGALVDPGVDYMMSVTASQ